MYFFAHKTVFIPSLKKMDGTQNCFDSSGLTSSAFVGVDDDFDPAAIRHDESIGIVIEVSQFPRSADGRRRAVLNQRLFGQWIARDSGLVSELSNFTGSVNVSIPTDMRLGCDLPEIKTNNYSYLPRVTQLVPIVSSLKDPSAF